tara:strand:- start:105 stop:536 length:432 start_codon:yes stop_codon:yes gene_type:complete
MFKLFKNKNLKNDNKNNEELLLKTASLLVHAAKIDENYTDKEKEIIKKTIIELGAEQSKINQIISEAEINEQNSNQILDFTKQIKNENNEFKIKIVEVLWNIIYSNEEIDIYESNLMRRLGGLLYVDDKIMGQIKEKIKRKNN